MPRVIAVMACVFCGLLGFVVGESNRPADVGGEVAAEDCPISNVAHSEAMEDAELGGTRSELVMCEAAKVGLSASVQELTLEKARLLEDLEFYRGLTDPVEPGERSVRVYRVGVAPLGGGRVLLSLILARAESLATKSKMTLRVSVRGVQEGNVRTIPLNELVVGEAPSTTFSFSHFHEWEAELKLPAGFTPDRLIVSIHSKGRKKPLLKSWLWSELEH